MANGFDSGAVPSNTKHVANERETKLRPSDGFDLSAFTSRLPGVSVRDVEVLKLSATYLDTHDLVLARAGITVRHRVGDGAPTWTVKLPVSRRSGALIRRELNIVGERGKRPREVAATVAAHLRGRRLVSVAQLDTHRTRIVLEGDTGNALVEIAHDDVRASRGRRTLGSWVEIEVEALDGPGGVATQRKVVRALRKAGCKAARPVPKLVQALGDEAAAAPEVSPVRLGAHPDAAEVLHAALSRSVAQVLDHDPRVRLGGDPEDLHQFRVAIRRLRSDLRTFRDLLDGEQASVLRNELRWVGDVTNRLRDLDVLRQWMVDHAAAVPAVDSGGLADLLQRCDAEIAIQRGALLRLLGSTRYLALVHELVRLVEVAPIVEPKRERQARRRLARQVRRRWDRLEAQVHAMGKDPSDAQLHQARISAKRCRAAVEAVEPLAGRRVHRLARSLADLQDVLGSVHDASVMEDWLRSEASTSATFVAGELTAIVRTEGHAHVARWPAVWAKAKRRRAEI